MEPAIALKKLNGVARMRDLRRFGIDRARIWDSIRSSAVIRLRNGWISLPTISPMEQQAVQAHSLLTCASAAKVLGLPAPPTPHFHVRGKKELEGGLRTTRRSTPNRIGACVAVPEMIIDYANCQSTEWTLALVDDIERRRLLPRDEWSKIESVLPKRLRKIVAMRSSLSESPLESIVRHRLKVLKIPHTAQVELGRFRVDFVISSGIILETHGAEFHSERADWEKDRRKVSWLRSNGWDVLEISYSQVMNDWDVVVGSIRAAISRQRKRGFPANLETK